MLLALLSLALSVLLWVSGLLESLERPSVNPALSVRQLQLELLAAPALPDGLRGLLIGSGVPAELAEQLREQRAQESGPGTPDQLLQQLLLQRLGGNDPPGSPALLEQLSAQVPPEQRALLGWLPEGRQGSGDGPSGAELAAQLGTWTPGLSPLTRQLLCDALGGPQVAGLPACRLKQAQRQAALRLLGVSWLPGALVLAGLVLLLRELWLAWRRRLVLPPMQGPLLNLVDVTLLIAGGFVVLGELGVPLLLAPLSGRLLAPLADQPLRQQSLQVVLLYTGLMLPPLAILARQLGGIATTPPAGGWLQWQWQPLASALARAFAGLLMVLPLVAVSGWLIDRLVGDPGGSNPLLELVLQARDPWALAGFGFTAVVLAPLFEETLFRGVLLPVLGLRWGAIPGLLASALTFAMAHLSLGELAPLLVLGLGLGWLRLRSGRLAPCVLMHALWNGLTFTNLVLLAG
ncbi:MAG: CPBP family intramembrane metalloprotease [Cyanobium sp. M30B3]|nr:MAG: CPBP family intramembrane metalloprotease [Cyanobium sp. M30B3]